MAGIRQDIAKLGGAWSTTMLWYARAVGELRTRAIADRTSWLYLAAIHGINPSGWIAQTLFLSTDPTPSRNEQQLMFNQCQHAGWFFLPWHRGYLAAFEAILADWITEQGGPNDWALPYWNYLDTLNPDARDIPQEFLDSTLPGTTDPNPLELALRGPAASLGPQTWIPRDISLSEQTSETIYTSVPGTLGYGGPISGFTQQGNAYGGIESDPHNLVHVMIGGDTTPNPAGWMYDPDFAALDPIFWVHHCNIDRLWAAWMTNSSNAQESSQAWRNGPFPRQFAMPDPSGGIDIFIPDDTLPGAPLAPLYDDLFDGTGIIPPTGGPVVAATPTTPISGSSLVGSNKTSITVGKSPVSSQVTLPSLKAPALLSAGIQRYYLNVEGVRGSPASGVLSVRITAPSDNDAAFTETLVFFGLGKASAPDGIHAGNGLSSTVEITNQLEILLAGTSESVDSLEVSLSQPESDGDRPEITVDRISIYAR